jgi:flavin-dependent dehydrogenase
MKTELVANTDSGAQTPVSRRRILILGGGFAGAYTALHLEKRLAGVADVEIVLAAKRISFSSRPCCTKSPRATWLLPMSFSR